MRRVDTAAIAIASFLLGCAGWGRELDARLQQDESDLALQVRCSARRAPDAVALELPIVIDAPVGLRPIGELYDANRSPKDAPADDTLRRHAFVLDGDAFASTLRGDVERCVGAAPGGDGADAALHLVVRLVEVQTTAQDPGFTALRGRVTSRVVLCAELRGGSGDVLWSKTLEGVQEKRVLYYRIAHHETTLSAAYCAALAQLDGAVPEITSALATLAAGRPADPPPQAPTAAEP